MQSRPRVDCVWDAADLTAAPLYIPPMSSIRARLLERDRERFVGRQSELERIAGMLDGSDPRRVAFVVGQGGVGKSALLRAASRLAADDGIDTVWFDGRDVTPFGDDIVPSLTAVADQRVLVVFDSYELVNSLDGHLRNVVLPDLSDSAVVLFASRQPPAPGWFEQGWDTVVDVIELGPLGDDDAIRILHSHDLDPELVDDIVRRSHGSPLALSIAAETGGNIDAFQPELTERLLREEVDADRLRILWVAALARVTTPELLADVLDDDDPQPSYKWLANLSFAEPLATGMTLHALVADAVRQTLRTSDPVGEAALRRRIADHLHRRAIAGNVAMSTELQHLIVDPTVRWGYSSDVGRRYRIDRLRPGDIDVITEILDAVGQGAWWAVTRTLFEQHPELVCIARDPNGRIGGYAVTVTPRNAPRLAHDDVLLGPWLAHTRDVLRTDSAVLWREAVDLTGELGEVTSLLGAGGLINSGIVNPRYLFLPIAPEIPAAGEFSARLDGLHVPELDLHAYGMELECHVVDTGPGGLIGNQRDWIYRETGAAPPATSADADPGELVKWLRQPAALVGGPAWLGASPSARERQLRELANEALRVFGHSADDQLARTIVTAAYLSDHRSHEAIARSLHLSRSAYFRRLNAATTRFGHELAALARSIR